MDFIKLKKRERRIKAVFLCMILFLSVFSGLNMKEVVVFATGSSTSANNENTHSNQTNQENYSINIGSMPFGDHSSAWDATDGIQVYYGTYDGQPVKYRVLPPSPVTQITEEACVLLDADNVLVPIPYHRSVEAGSAQASGNPNEWTGCDLQSYLGRRYAESQNGVVGMFTQVEANAIAGTELVGGEEEYATPYATFRDYASTDYLFPLSAREADTLYLDKVSRIKTGNNGRWWLRSSNTKNGIFSGVAFPTGEIYNGNVDTADVGLSPAFNLKRSSILFSSSATEGLNFDKSLPPASGSVNMTHSRDWKVTLKDAGKAIKITDKKSMFAAPDGAVTVPYTYTDQNTQNPVNQISVMITDKNFESSNTKILYYGALQDIRNEAGESTDVENAKIGTGTFTLPDSLPEDYRIYILAESISTDHYSDYASDPTDIRHLHCVCGTSENTNAHTEHTGITYQPLPDDYIGGTLDSGNYCLKDDIVLSENIIIQGEVNLCLNGNKITSNRDDTVLKVGTGNILSLSDCIGTAEMGATIFLKGGTINQYSGKMNASVLGQYGRYEIFGGETGDNSAFRLSGGEIYLSGSPRFSASEGKANIILSNNQLKIYGRGTTGSPYVGDKITIECGLEAGSVVVYDVAAEAKDKFGTTNDVELYLKESNLVAHQNHIGGTADCITRAVCSVCNEPYADIAAFRHIQLVKVEAKAATKQSAGNITYWKCTGCKKYFSDAAGTKEIKNPELSKTNIVPLTGDNTHIGSWLYAAMLCVAGLIVILKTTVLKGRRK